MKKIFTAIRQGDFEQVKATLANYPTEIGRDAFAGCKCTVIYKGKTYAPEDYGDLHK